MKRYLILYFLLISNIFIYAQEIYYNAYPIKIFDPFLPIKNYNNQENIKIKKIKKIIELKSVYSSNNIKDTLKITNYDRQGKTDSYINFENGKRESQFLYKRDKNVETSTYQIFKTFEGKIITENHSETNKKFDNERLIYILEKYYKNNTLEYKYYYNNFDLIRREDYYDKKIKRDFKYIYNQNHQLLNSIFTEYNLIDTNGKKTNKIFENILYNYDKKNRIIKIVANTISKTKEEEYNFMYHNNGNLIEENYIEYRYNNQGKEYKVNGKINYFYDTDNRINKLIESNSDNEKIESDIYYNKNGNLEKVISKISNGRVFRYFYTYKNCSEQTYDYNYNEKGDLISFSIKEDNKEVNSNEYVVEYYD